LRALDEKCKIFGQRQWKCRELKKSYPESETEPAKPLGREMRGLNKNEEVGGWQRNRRRPKRRRRRKSLKRPPLQAHR